MKPQKICSICAVPIHDNYCGKCGQQLSEKPTTTFSLIGDFLSNFFSLERSVFATVIKILLNPKSIVNNYYNGFRNYYASPGKILLYGIAIVALHLSFVHKNIMGISLELENMNSQYLFWLILFPFLLMISYLTFVSVEKKLAKHIISITYVSSALFILLTIINDAIILLAGDQLETWAFIIFVVLVFFSNSRVLTAKEKNIFIVLNTVLQMIIFTAVIGIILLITNTLSAN